MWQKNTIKKYKLEHEIFVETGTWQGDGVQLALDLGFKQIYSCDIDETNILKAKNRFENQPVICSNQSSEEFLKNICPTLKTPSLIWLDAHVMPDATGEKFSTKQLELSKEFNVNPCPILQELSTIFLYSCCAHTIIIDDYHCFGNWEFSNLTDQETRQFILNHNTNYNFSVEENTLCCFPGHMK